MEKKQIAASCVGLVNSICLIMQESYVAQGDSWRKRERERERGKEGRKTEKRRFLGRLRTLPEPPYSPAGP